MAVRVAVAEARVNVAEAKPVALDVLEVVEVNDARAVVVDEREEVEVAAGVAGS